MALIVEKFGGAVLSDVAKIRLVAEYIADLKAQGNDIVAVVSAMGDTTDDLTRMALSVTNNPSKREMDMLLSVGERITMSLLAMAIENTGKAQAVSFTGSQVGIITDTRHTDARIVEIRSDRLQNALQAGKVVIVAGFQGVSLEKEITTLGRGGSDTTAIALAAALHADRCDLVKEVPGLFTADPKVIPGASPIPEIDFAAVRGLSLGGARILRDACIDLAEHFGIEIRVGNPQHFTTIKPRIASSVFSVSLKEGYTLYENIPPDRWDDLPETAEIIGGGESALIFLNSQSGYSQRALDTDGTHGIAKITAVGDEMYHLRDFYSSLKQLEIFQLIQQPRECRLYFKAENPSEILRKTHNFLKKMLDMQNK